MKAFQECYAEEFSHCYGCGTSNELGWHIKSYWLNNDPHSHTTIAHFTPEPHYTGGYPQNVYVGLIAAILDCHGNSTASAAGYRHFRRAIGSSPCLRYVTANLQLNFIHPTPMDTPLKLLAHIQEVNDRKVVMNLELWAKDQMTVSGSMVSVLLPPK